MILCVYVQLENIIVFIVALCEKNTGLHTHNHTRKKSLYAIFNRFQYLPG